MPVRLPSGRLCVAVIDFFGGRRICILSLLGAIRSTGRSTPESV